MVFDSFFRTIDVSASGLKVSAREHEAVVADEEGNILHRIRKGDIISIHGTSGEIYIGSRRLDRITSLSVEPCLQTDSST